MKSIINAFLFLLICSMAMSFQLRKNQQGKKISPDEVQLQWLFAKPILIQTKQVSQEINDLKTSDQNLNLVTIQTQVVDPSLRDEDRVEVLSPPSATKYTSSSVISQAQLNQIQAISQEKELSKIDFEAEIYYAMLGSYQAPIVEATFSVDPLQDQAPIAVVQKVEKEQAAALYEKYVNDQLTGQADFLHQSDDLIHQKITISGQTTTKQY